MLKKTRLRGPNFTSSERLLLCNIISEYKSIIIENKKTDGANLQQKQEAWFKITEKFNAVAHEHHRTVESLQMNYKNLKKKMKKNASDAEMDVPGKQKLESEMPLKQCVSTKFSSLVTEKLELVALQKELLKCQLLEEKEKLQHNQLLRAMELEDAKKQYQHNELIRQLQLQSFNK